MADLTNAVRGTHGALARNPDTAKREAEALRLRARGQSYEKIGEALGVSKQAAHQMVQRGLKETLAEPAEDVRQMELMKLDHLETRMLEIMEAMHVRIAPNGTVVRFDGQPVVEPGPALQAANTLLRISESRRKLLGLDMPTKVDVSGGVEYRVIGVNMEELR